MKPYFWILILISFSMFGCSLNKEIDALPSISDGNEDPQLCGVGQYNSGDSCINVGIGYFSSIDDDSRTACPVNSSTSGTTSSSITSCLGDVDFYSCADGTCDAVGIGNYSAVLDDTQTACSNMPANATSVTYNSDGSGINSCGIASADSCSPGYAPNGVVCDESCGAGQYLDGGACDDVEVGYYSPVANNSRTACPANSSTIGAASSSIASCLGDVDFYSCADGTCDAVGTGNYSAVLDDTQTACSNMSANATSVTYNSDGNGTNSCGIASADSCSPGYAPNGAVCDESCGAGQYWNGAVCVNVEIGYYSPVANNSRTACPANSSTVSATSSAISFCLGDVDFYSCVDGSCDAVGTGNYSAALDDTRTACSNMPTNATSVTYSSDGNGADNCGIASADSCEAGYTPSGAACIEEIPVLDVNGGIVVVEAKVITVETLSLSTSHPTESNSNITYALEVAPTRGDLKLNGSVLLVTNTFTQQDLIDFKVTYQHTGVDATDDSFDFSVKDSGSNFAVGATGASPATFNITVNANACVAVDETFTSDATYTVPANCAQITVQAWGGGGGGSQDPEDGGVGGPGGGGGYAEVILAVTPGTQFKVKIGLGGQGGDGCGSAGGGSIYAGGSGGATTANGSDGAGSGNGGSGALGTGVAGIGGDGKFGGGGGGGGEVTVGAGGGGASVFQNFSELVDYAIAGGGGGGGGNKDSSQALQGGAGCGINGSGGDGEADGGGGGGGACYGHSAEAGSNQTPGNSGEAGGSGAGGSGVKAAACVLADGSDGKIVIKY